MKHRLAMAMVALAAGAASALPARAQTDAEQTLPAELSLETALASRRLHTAAPGARRGGGGARRSGAGAAAAAVNLIANYTRDEQLCADRRHAAREQPDPDPSFQT
jgi:hypothetical protein